MAGKKTPTYRAIVHASEILTGDGIRRKEGRKVLEEDLGRIEDGALVYTVRKVGGRELPDKIEWVGKTHELPTRYARARKTDLKRKRAVIPGLVDCHTHLIFAGDRSDEFAARCAGTSYQEIASKGGGILKTVRATRLATPQELETLATERLKEAMRHGVRTLEIKSGYGLSRESELRILEVIPKLRKKFPELTLTSTFLGAHAFPPEMGRTNYITELLEVVMPEVIQSKLADSCDVFVDEGYYTLDEGRRVLKRARELGFKVKVHADEMVNTESARMAVELGALSADHLLKISDAGIEALARSKTVAVLLPGTAFYLKTPQAPARKLLDAGAIVALSTDYNPGTCMCLSLPAIMTIAGLYLGMSRAELLASVTHNGAKALGLADRKGTLSAGLDADFAVLPFEKFEDLYYRFGW